MLRWESRRNRLLQEIETHIEMETQENLDAGMPAEAARSAARKKFGNVLLTAEKSRLVWGGLWLERLLHDLRYALRSLGHAPGYTATLVLTLVLGLGSVTTMLAIVESTLMRPMAFPDPEQLVLIYAESQPEGTSLSPHSLSYRQIEELRRSTRSFASLSAYNTAARPVGASDGTRITVLTEATPGTFQMLGIPAKSGRLMESADAQAPVAVVNDEFWRERLHADPKAIGSDITVSGQLRTVIGVLPAGIRFPQGTGGPVVYVPVSLNASGEDDFGSDTASVIARVKPGVSLQQALADAQSVFVHSDPKNAARQGVLKIVSYREYVTGDMQRPLLMLLGGVGVLLLIACANATNLQIGRAANRIPEMQMRSALGASFGLLLQQLVMESILLSLLAAALGSALSYGAVALVRRAYGTQFPRFDELSVHPAVLGAAALLAILMGVIASLAPILHIRRQTASAFAAKNTTRRGRLPGILVALQVALTCVLLATCGLFVRTVRSLQNVKLGFDPSGVTTLVLMPENLHQDPELSRQIETRLLRRFETLPGVQSVTMQSAIPFSSYNVALHGTTEVSGRAYRDGDAAYYSMVSTNFVHTSGIHLLRGHDFLPKDETDTAIAILVNQAFVNQFLGGRAPIGASLKFHREPEDKDADLPFTQPMAIIGVVENELQGGDLGAPYEPMVYLDYLQLPKGSLLNMVFSMSAQYAVRSMLAPAALASELRAAVKQEAPTMVEMSLQPMEESISQSLGQRRLALRLVSGFGAVALVLSAVGIYGVLAYAVAVRRREIGVRVALGSSRAQAAGLVMRQAGTMVLFGLVPGVAGAWAAGHAVRSFLFGVKVLDTATLIAVGFVLVAVAGTAAFLPALRAALVDPAETLRAE
jgi:putative ABC transport system permease protein